MTMDLGEALAALADESPWSDSRCRARLQPLRTTRGRIIMDEDSRTGAGGCCRARVTMALSGSTVVDERQQISQEVICARE